MPFITGQAIQRISPNKQSGRWIKSGGGGGVISPIPQTFYTFQLGGLSPSPTTNPVTINVPTDTPAWQIRAKFKWGPGAPSVSAILGNNNGNFRLQRETSGAISLTATSLVTSTVIAAPDIWYSLVIDLTWTGAAGYIADFILTNLEDDSVQTDQKTTTASGNIATFINIAAVNVTGSNGWLGPISELGISIAGSDIHYWPMAEGGPQLPTFFDPTGSAPIVVDNGTGFWTPQPADTWLNAIAIGDSIPAATGSYPSLLATASSYDDSQATGGTQLDVIAQQIDPAVAAFPSGDYIILEGGINNIVTDKTAASMITTMEAMILKCHSYSLDIIVLNVGPWKASTGFTWTQLRQDEEDIYNAWVAANGVALGYVPVDMNTPLVGGGTPETLLPSLGRAVDDGLHPGTQANNPGSFPNTGNQAIADAIDAAVIAARP